MLKEIRLHGRGGQGVVTAAELLASAAFEDGKFTQAYPSFGSERMGSPVASFVRLSDRRIRLRSQIYEPDYIIVQDPTVIGAVDVFKGAKENTLILINVDKRPEELHLPAEIDKKNVRTIPATQIALEFLGKPIPNTVMVGAFAGATGEIGLKAVGNSIRKRFPGEMGEKNVLALEKAYQLMKGAK
jgi:pyruvate ferredoxin oxidoreductase gamma subunit